MRTLSKLALLVLLLVVVASAQRRHRDPLTDAEADQMREVAQEPEKRLKLIIKFAQARLQAIEQLRGSMWALQATRLVGRRSSKA